MKTCETCRYWTGRDGYEGSLTDPCDPDTYEPMPMPFEVRYCEHPRLMKFERPVERDQASCVDGSGYRAKLACGPDFGCVHHSLANVVITDPHRERVSPTQEGSEP
jgi:hypothetical protein